MKKGIAPLLLLFALPALSQVDSAVHASGPWKHTMVAGLNLTQVSFTDWAQGGENADAWAVSAEGRSERNDTSTDWTNDYKFAFGQTKIGSQSTRKSDDKIDLGTVLTLKLGSYINPYAAASLKSQFAVGYIYDNAGNATAVSKFFDPAYIMQSVGAGYQPITQIKTRLGLALREILTSEFPVYADDPSTQQVEKTRIEGGAEAAVNIEWKVMDNILFTSTVELFSAFKTFDQVVVRSDNTLAAQVNKYITANFNVQLINERPVTPRTQVKQTIALGLRYAIL
ncbi:MAG TPA: DUF3078 domain-containing protein [Bacteroidota bacterium]|nr:DUF3078 domain-containing protein [Bacteroidota bacterium]